MSDPSRVVVSGPPWVFAPACGGALRRGYRPGTAAKQLQLMAHLSRWMDGAGSEPAELRRRDRAVPGERRASVPAVDDFGPGRLLPSAAATLMSAARVSPASGRCPWAAQQLRAGEISGPVLALLRGPATFADE